jgi:phosphoribosyl 1,2-cyclic phosphate phosphodiesterase
VLLVNLHCTQNKLIDYFRFTNKDRSHFTLNEAVGLVNELQIPHAYFTHISHQLGLHEHINKELPAGIELGWDGLEVMV